MPQLPANLNPTTKLALLGGAGVVSTFVTGAVAARSLGNAVEDRGLSTVVTMASVALAAWAVVAALRALRQPFAGVASTLERAATGDLTARVAVDGSGEAAHLGQALNDTLDRTSAALASVSSTATSLALASEDLSAIGYELRGNSNESSAQASSASASVEQVAANVSMVASASQEMGASIREIARSAQQAAQVGTDAVRMADAATGTVGKLGDSSTQVGEVVKVITSIAEQTNLLALNATIEAARAGDAGKGFAVVANEVKALANQTAAATGDIAHRIDAIQSDAAAAAHAIDEIASVISQINDIQMTIASAVEEQSVTTGEIGRSAGETAAGTSEISASVAAVARVARDADEGAAGCIRSASDLALLAQELKRLVEPFTMSANGSMGRSAPIPPRAQADGVSSDHLKRRTLVQRAKRSVPVPT